MAIYPIAPVEQQPDEHIIRWSIREASFMDGTTSRHLVGLISRNRHGRATSAIQHFDANRMAITTRSGRIYYLKDEPGHDPDAEYVWRSWCHINEVQSVVDVTHILGFTDK